MNTAGGEYSASTVRSMECVNNTRKPPNRVVRAAITILQRCAKKQDKQERAIPVNPEIKENERNRWS
jgi:hypothetical protein